MQYLHQCESILKKNLWKLSNSFIVLLNKCNIFSALRFVTLKYGGREGNSEIEFSSRLLLILVEKKLVNRNLTRQKSKFYYSLIKTAIASNTIYIFTVFSDKKRTL